jgi:Stigma-specific protein, Stig1
MAGLGGVGAIDTIARSLASGMSRREALRAGGAALAGAVALSPKDALAAVGLTCPSGRVKCGTTCCAKGASCVVTTTSKRCVCPTHQVACNGVCLSLATNHQNCGKCGHACLSNQACCSGKCTNLQTSVSSCGKCGHACQRGAFVAAVACQSGKCKIVSCDSGHADCDGTFSTGCETDTTTASNCGTCGKTCSVQNGTAGCSAGTCVIAGCTSPFQNCDGQFSSGCNIDTSTDVQNCGGCGMSCGTVNNGTAGCTAGTCVIASCTGSFRDCDGQFSNGCETDTNTSVQHCGGCGMSCGAVNHGTAGCTAGTCVIASCDGTFRDCDGQFNTGCEVDTSTDAHNCGGCGMTCNTGYACVASQCKTSCAGDSDCTSTFYCNTGNNTCVPKQLSGSPCASGNQCQSGMCSGGHCL